MSGKPPKASDNADLMPLSQTVTYNLFMPELLKRIDQHIHAEPMSLESYTITFTVPRHSPTAMLLTEEKYTHMIASALKMKTDAKANIFVKPNLAKITNFPVRMNAPGALRIYSPFY
jgi:hypothetical protein